MRPTPAGPLVVATEQALAEIAAAWIVDAIAVAIAKRGACSIALSGGHTPREVYRCLAVREADVRWDCLAVYFGDERRVAPDDPASNFRMASEALLARVPLPATRVFRMPAERTDADRAADEYAARLPERVDVLLLGIGADGHTASLFPGAPTLDVRERCVVPAESPVVPHGRMTITPPVIARARSIAMIAAGADKAEAVRRAREGPVDWHATPAQLARRGTWLVDRDAATLCEGRWTLAEASASTFQRR